MGSGMKSGSFLHALTDSEEIYYEERLHNQDAVSSGLMKASIILDAEEIRSKDLYLRICGGLTCAGGSESRRYVY
jgi:hypothetical protein